MSDQNAASKEGPKKFALPPEKHRIRGLNFNSLRVEQREIVEKIAEIVKADPHLDLQIRDSYLNIYYLGGNLLEVRGFSPRSRSISCHFDLKYLCRGKNSTIDVKLPERRQVDKWLGSVELLKEVMDGWFELHPKLERKIQHDLCLMHRTENSKSPWIVIDIEYAAWLTDRDKGRKMCRFDMVAVERTGLREGRPLIVHLIELKQGNEALAGASGVKKHADDLLQFIRSSEDAPARYAFTQSICNIIDEKVNLGLLPPELQGCKDFELNVAFLLKGSNIKRSHRETYEQALKGTYADSLFVEYETWVPK